MDDYELQYRYERILETVKVIESMTDNLESRLGSLMNTMEEAILLDNKPYELDRIKRITNINRNINSSINNRIIPSLRRKI